MRRLSSVMALVLCHAPVFIDWSRALDFSVTFSMSESIETENENLPLQHCYVS